MNIVRSNYQEACALLRSLKNKPIAFASLDCEFTGIHSRPIQITDTPEQRYENMREMASKFQLMQFGFTLFVARQPEGYEVFPFNVYLFPAAERGAEVVLNLAAATFHREHKFDFNKWIYEGLDCSQPEVLSSTEEPATAVKIKVSVEGSESEDSLGDPDQDTSTKNGSDSEPGEPTERGRSLFETLVDFRVPLVGHNLLVDLMFLYAHFVNPLPATLREFKAAILKLFPAIFDTMLLFSDPQLKALPGHGQSSALEAMYSFFQYAEGPEVVLGPETESYLESHFHEAGYDSYVTGYCFAKMLSLLSVFELENYRNRLYSHKSPFDITLLARGDDLHENTLVYIGCMKEGRRFEELSAKLNTCKEPGMYMEHVDDSHIFFGIQKRPLYSMPDLVSVAEWKQYVKEQDGLGKEPQPRKRGSDPAARGKVRTGPKMQDQWRYPQPVLCMCFTPPTQPTSLAQWQLLQTQCYFSGITTNMSH